jgi:ElaB/YqjD/DUF883 family membrane-anchored ribosome-binding protein
MSQEPGNEGQMAGDIAALRNELARLGEAVAALVSAEGKLAGETVKAMAADAAAAAAQKAGALHEAGQETFDAIGRQARELSGDVGKTIERNPIGAAAVAFGIGLLLGLLSRR